MPLLTTGEAFPSDFVFKYIPIDLSSASGCVLAPLSLTRKHFEDKTVLIVGVPGAFTPTCNNTHLPPFISNLEKLRSKGIDVVVVLSANDPFVMNNWGSQLLKVVQDKMPHDLEVIFASDPNIDFSSKYEITVDSRKFGMGFRIDRFALLKNKQGIISYFKRETEKGKVLVSGVDAILRAKL